GGDDVDKGARARCRGERDGGARAEGARPVGLVGQVEFDAVVLDAYRGGALDRLVAGEIRGGHGTPSLFDEHGTTVVRRDGADLSARTVGPTLPAGRVRALPVRPAPPNPCAPATGRTRRTGPRRSGSRTVAVRCDGAGRWAGGIVCLPGSRAATHGFGGS